MFGAHAGFFTAERHEAHLDKGLELLQTFFAVLWAELILVTHPTCVPHACQHGLSPMGAVLWLGSSLRVGYSSTC